ncbi:MAG: penicillin-binding protein 1C [Cyclobacteriaceae bacterium]|nr:penicillin-binding protein 1C [Cyclobacteriaceae bacterium]
MTAGRKRSILYGAALLSGMLLYWLLLLLPDPMFKDPYSTVLEDRDGNLLGASIAADGQWRFPLMDSLPSKYRAAVLAYEDRRFEEHFGVDFLALGRSVHQNLKAGKVISGGSTLTMQVIKLSRKGKPRTYLEKVIEILMATRLELALSKDEIFNLYAAHAPFGGNVVGIEAAGWRYFGRRTENLSWAEAALLAVLPNNPSLLHPGKNQQKLKAKRDRLLRKLADLGYLDQTSLALSMEESIPGQPLALPRLAPHLLDRAMQEGLAQTRVRSSLDVSLQQRALDIVARHYDRLRGNQINNAAAIIIDVQTGKTLAYVGNTQSGSANHEQVDILRAPRSTGSILKPFLFAALLDEGALLPKTLMPDIPTSINGFAPRNFSHTYDGAVPINQALIRSLNIPFVHALREYRYEKFYGLLKKTGLTTLSQPADHYGLSLILGGAEATLWEVTGSYAALADQLNKHNSLPLARRNPGVPFKLSYLQDTVIRSARFMAPVSAAATWLTFESLKELYRPGEEMGWKSFSSSKPIAWKTGTSFGFRDGWAVGVTPRYVVGVWTGNADGEGRPGLVGTETAAPILFELFAQLPGHDWFREPLDEMEYVAVCRRSGNRPGEHCLEIDSTWVTRAALRSVPCRFHKVVYLSTNGRYRVNASCAATDERVPHRWFVLPPVQEYYYKSKNITYKSLPPYRGDCPDPASVAAMDLVYPRPNARIFVPRELDGKGGSAVFEVAHRIPRTQIFWHLDGRYLGSTRGSHKMLLAPAAGKHTVSVVDESGQYLTRTFEVLAKP